MHRRHHNAAWSAGLIFLGAALTLSACSQMNWLNKVNRPDPPGLLGALFNRKPPAITIRASSPYPDPLSSPLAPLVTPDIADQAVAENLRLSLKPAARMSLAEASMLAAAAATGTAVSWKGGDASGIVTPARDVYLSVHGHVCRDLRQEVARRSGPQVAQITLCYEELGDSRAVWLPPGIN